jgi:hypothetical protein
MGQKKSKEKEPDQMPEVSIEREMLEKERVNESKLSDKSNDDS